MVLAGTPEVVEREGFGLSTGQCLNPITQNWNKKA